MNAIVNVMLSNVIVVAALFCLLMLLRRWIRNPAVFHGLAVLLLVKLLVPWGWQPTLSVLPRGDADVVDARSAPGESSPPFERDEFQVDGLEQPDIGANSLESETADVEAPATTASSPVASNTPGSREESADRAAESPRWTFPPAVLIGLAWLIGTTVWLLIALRRIVTFRKSLRLASPAPAELQKLATTLARRLGLKRSPPIVLVPGRLSPVLWSLGGSPWIILSASLLDRLDDDERQSLLLHELAHYRRGDHWVRLVELAATGIYWWYPVLWWLRRELRLAEELCCDTWVVESLPDQRRAYAEALVKTAGWLSAPAVVPGTTGIGSTRCLEERITRIMRDSLATRVSRRMKAAIAILAAGLVCCAPMLGQSAADSSNEDVSVLSPIQGLAVAPIAFSQAGESSGTPTGNSDVPQVVEVYPPNGTTDVNPVTELRIRFNRPMSPSLALVRWETREPGGFRRHGSMEYDPERHEFIMPVLLTPDFTHELTVNGDDWPGGFQTADGVRAPAFSWSFTTAPLGESSNGQAPRLIGAEPEQDTEIPLYSLVRVRFDRPMNPDWYGVRFTGVRSGDQPELQDLAVYDPELRQFELPLVLPGNWNGEVQLVDFMSADGVPAEPVALKYRTLRSPFSAELEQTIEQLGQRVEENGNRPQLVDLLTRIGAASRSVTSVSVQVQLSASRGPAGWSNHYDAWDARFVRQGQQFLGDVSHGMQQPWQIGSDGATCWFRHGDSVVECPDEDVTEKNVSIGDPFGTANAGDVAPLIREFKLEYQGEVVLDGRRCHQVRSFAAVERLWTLVQQIGHVIDWYFDSETLMLVRIDAGGSTARFHYADLNELIPSERFRPPDDLALERQAPDPLDADYTHLFLTVADGSSGSLRCRWGRKGPGGTRSGGLSWNW